MCHFPAIIVNFLWNQRKAQTINYTGCNALGLKNKTNKMFLEHKVTVTSMIHGSLSPQHGVASGCRWRRKPPDMAASSQYTQKAVTGSRRGVVLQLANWTRCLQLLTTTP
jgi:hypothetical protein